MTLIKLLKIKSNFFLLKYAKLHTYLLIFLLSLAAKIFVTFISGGQGEC